jgi:hypothetical protein
MKALAPCYRQKNLCAALGVSRNGYHDWKKRKPSVRQQGNDLLLDQIEILFAESYRSYGSPRMTQALRQQGTRCGKNRIARLMKEQGLRAKQKRRWHPQTTQSHHQEPVVENLLNAREATTEPNQVWRADITYVEPARDGSTWLESSMITPGNLRAGPSKNGCRRLWWNGRSCRPWSGTGRPAASSITPIGDANTPARTTAGCLPSMASSQA